jgi:hypothetical protein
VFLPRVSGRAAKRALKRLRLLVAGRNRAALNSSGSQLIGVRYVQVGLEERENLTVTWNVSIAIRSLCVTLLAAILALVLVVALAEDADARRVRRKVGVGASQFSSQTFQPPDRFSCSPLPPLGTVDTTADWDPPTIKPPKPTDGYRCTAVGSVGPTFDLNDVLDRAAGPGVGEIRGGEPLHQGESGPPPGPLATPDLIQCHIVDKAGDRRDAENFSCEFPENQQTCVFTLGTRGGSLERLKHVLVATNVDVVNDTTGKTVGAEVDSQFLFLPFACHPLPIAVPAGADAAGEGSAAWPFGLVLAAGGAMVGGVVIARRRILHDS